MKRKSVLTLILCCLLLAGCAGGNQTETEVTENTTDTAASSETTAPAIAYDYPDKDYEGYEFVFLNQDQCSWANPLIAPEESNGELINDAMFERNSRISEKFNITISDYKVTSDEIPTLVKNTVNSGDDAYDVALFPYHQLSAVLLDGYLVDLNTISSLRLSEPWWDQLVVDAATIEDKCYLASSDITFFPFEATWVVYFNEDRFEELGFELPYDLVRNGEWTIDKLTEYCVAAADLNGQDSFKYNESGSANYGIITHSQIVQTLLFGGDVTLIDQSGDIPVFDGESDRAYSLYEKIATLLGTEGAHVDRDKEGGVDTDQNSFCRSAFKTGRFMFMSETLGHIAGLRDFNDSFGVLPVPKYDASQDGYRSMMATWGTLMTTIPATASDPERTGVILDALAYDSHMNLLEPYYDTYLTQKGARNEDSAEMLQIVRDTRVINVGSMYGWTTSVLSSITTQLENGNSAVSSVIASAKSSIEALITKTMESMSD